MCDEEKRYVTSEKFRRAGRDLKKHIEEKTVEAGKAATKAEKDLHYEAYLASKGYTPEQIREMVRDKA